jgi:uncharacterized protein
MLRKTLSADTTIADQEQGTFTAIVSAWTEDREQDVIERNAFDGTIAAWRESGKNLPLLFEHSTTVVGAIDPQSMVATEAGLEVAGEVDRSTEEGQAAWRSIKADTAGFSIGYMSEATTREGGGRTITAVDLLEISITSKPMHPATRATSWKSADHAVRQQARDAMLACLRGATPKRPDEMSLAELKAYGEELTRDIRPPITIHTFEIE